MLIWEMRQAVVTAVVLTADLIEGLDVDRVRGAYGRLRFRAAGNAAGHVSHLRRSGSLPEVY